MPAKPTWLGRWTEIERRLEELPDTVDRPAVQELLRVGPRRAQQIMGPCVTRWIGSNALADRSRLIEHLRQLTCGQAERESARQRRLAHLLFALQRDRRETPQVLVEAPAAIVHQELLNLPAGVTLSAGKITVTFDAPQQALEKLLALAMAIGNDLDIFERIVSGVGHSANAKQ